MFGRLLFCLCLCLSLLLLFNPLTANTAEATDSDAAYCTEGTCQACQGGIAVAMVQPLRLGKHIMAAQPLRKVSRAVAAVRPLRGAVRLVARPVCRVAGGVGALLLCASRPCRR